MSLLFLSWNIYPEQFMKSHGGGFEILWKLEIWRAGWLLNADQRRDLEPHADGGTAFSWVLLGPEGWWVVGMVASPSRQRQSPAGMGMLQQGSSRILQFHLQMKWDWAHLISERCRLSLLGSSWLPLWTVQGRTPRQWNNHPPSHQSPSSGMHG